MAHEPRFITHQSAPLMLAVSEFYCPQRQNSYAAFVQAAKYKPERNPVGHWPALARFCLHLITGKPSIRNNATLSLCGVSE